MIWRILLLALALAAPARAQGSLSMLCAPAADWCEAIAAAFQRETGIRVAMARKSTGEILAQLRAEAANPNSSGTAYTIIAGLVQLWDEDRAFDYLRRLHANVNAYTRSGAAPMQAVARGETALVVSFDMETISMQQAGFPIELRYPEEGTSYEVVCMSIIRGARNLAQARRFYGWYLTPAAMDIGPRANQFHAPAHPGATPDTRIADLSRIRLIDYDFRPFGEAATRRRILERWDREIGALPR